MIINLTTRTDGLQNVRRRVKLIQDAPPKVLQKVGQLEVKDAQTRIVRTKVDPDGHAWAPWSSASIAARSRSNPGRGLLYKSGALLNSIQMRVSPKTLTIYSNLSYSRYLQQGTSKMPARRFIGWSTTSINRMKQIYRDEIK